MEFSIGTPAKIWPGIFLTLLGTIVAAALIAMPARAQVLSAGENYNADANQTNPIADTTMKPGKALLYSLETKFGQATATGGGKAFSEWFAADGTLMGNGQSPVYGREAISRQANWLAKDYQLIWTPTDAVLSPLGDMGYTWGHYEGRSKDVDGSTKVTTGRYLTIWRKEADGTWKVLLDSSSNEPPGAGDCCKLPHGD